MERRTINVDGLAIETRADGKPAIVGYASVFYRADDPGTEFRMMDDLYERIDSRAFDGALSRPDDVRGLFNHDSNHVLGRSSAGTLKLTKDTRGLRYEITPPDTQLGRDLLESIRRGDITGSSFAFRVTGQAWTRDEQRKVDIRTITDVTLYDVGPVTFPAYESSTTGVRGSGDTVELQAARQQWQASTRSRETMVRARVVSLDE